MQVVGVGVATLVALILLYSGTNSSTVVSDAAIIQAEVPKVVTHQTQFEYLPAQQADAVPAVVTRVVPKTVAPKVAPEPVVVSVPETIPQETAVSVCLGKFAGARCTLDSQEGTCLTLARSAVTCVPH